MNRSESPKTIQWEKPPLEKELNEIEGIEKQLSISKAAIIRAFEEANLEELSDDDWSKLENCDSRDQGWTLEEINEYRGKERDVFGINARFENLSSVHAPVVLFRDGHNPYLIGGNTRLMLCRAHNIRPTVLALRLNA